MGDYKICFYLPALKEVGLFKPDRTGLANRGKKEIRLVISWPVGPSTSMPLTLGIHRPTLDRNSTKRMA